MNREVRNVAASVRARLLEGAKARGEEFALTLQRYAAERFLYRLGHSMFADRFVLKGAMLFSLWQDMYRATKDVDLAGYRGAQHEQRSAGVLDDPLLVGIQG
jgi:hypothetical protein